MTDDVRTLGIPVIKEAHWGTHFCQFYKTKKDLIDILVPYFKTGLTNNECCIWVTSEPLLANEAKEALQKEVKKLAQFIKKGQIEILDYSKWYTKSGKFEGDKGLHAWVEKEKEAIKKGFDGLRVTGNTSWLGKDNWKKFYTYEKSIDGALENHRVIALCSYSLNKCNSSEILDVVKNHQFSIVRQGGRWNIIESSGGRQTRRMQEELEKKYRTIISSMVDALIVLDTEGKIQTVNKSICDLLNYEEKDLIGQSFGTLIAEEEEEEEEEEASTVDKRFRKLLRKGPVIDYNTSFSTKLSKKIPVSIYGSVIRDEKGKLVGVVLTARDMRARIASENKIKESEERYRGVVENLTDAIFLLDERGKFVHMNRPGIKLYGWKKLGDIAERNFVEDAHRKYSGVLTKAVETAWSGKMAECHYESTTNGGLHKWWEVTLVPLRDAFGKTLNIVGISRDITLKRQSEQLIKFYKEYAEHIVANLPISIIILNREIEINFANQHFIKRLGKSRKEVMDKPLEEVLGRAYKGMGFDEKIRAVIKGDETMPRGRFELRGKDYDYQILRFKERIGRRFNAMFIMEDITERVRLEEQIRDAEKMSAIGQFTAGIAHEINNPLGIVLANIQYLTSNMDKIDFTDKKQVSDLNEVLETIGEQSRRCGEIVSNLLHFTHRGKGEEENVNIDKVVRRTMQMMEHQLRLSKIEYTVDLDGSLPMIKGDVNRLQQIFVNLVLNAGHAMTSGGKLHIKTFVEGGNWVCISFRDTGPGIPRKHQKRIFEPFYTTRKAGEGTGLGLSVVRSIIQEHGGLISVDSKRGAGATFKITLPVAKKGLFGLWK